MIRGNGHVAVRVDLPDVQKVVYMISTSPGSAAICARLNYGGDIQAYRPLRPDHPIASEVDFDLLPRTEERAKGIDWAYHHKPSGDPLEDSFFVAEAARCPLQ
jgi:hypothetical protein